MNCPVDNTELINIRPSGSRGQQPSFRCPKCGINIVITNPTSLPQIVLNKYWDDISTGRFE